MNLVANAAKYNPGEAPWVEVGYLTPDEAAADAGAAPRVGAAPLVLYVRDNGIGIPARHHEVIFRLFRRLHAREQHGGGSGAGLTLVRQIVERHGGAVWVASEPGAGATFYFTLAPGATEPPAA